MAWTDTDARVPVNDLSRAEDLDELADRARDVILSGRYLDGNEVRGLEGDLTAHGLGHAVAVGNGTDALELALRAVGCVAGDSILTAANAGFYASTAILRIGAFPTYIDVDPTTAAISPSTVLSMRGLPAAVVVTHLYGLLADIEPIAEWCHAQDIPLVEDCAQALGARRGGKLAGTFGDAAACSFYPTKNLGALGDGGAVLSVNPEIAQRARSLRQYGWDERNVVTQHGGRNSRLDELQAAFLRHRLPRLDGLNTTRRGILARYAEALPEMAGRLLWRPDESCTGHLAIVVTRDRDRFRRTLGAGGIDTAIHYPVPDHRQPLWRGTFPPLPETEALCEHVVTLPCFPGMTEDEIGRVCAALGRTR